MIPILKPGDEVLVDTQVYKKIIPQKYEIVVAHHPIQKDLYIIKRVFRVDHEGSIYLIGDNPEESTDSRAFGEVNIDKIIGKVTSRLP